MRVLVTGVTGYIGSHAAVELLDVGHDVVGVDDFSASSPSVRAAIERAAGRPIELHELDLRNRAAVNCLFDKGNFDAVIHFAGRKFVGESMDRPVRYYSRNVGASINLAAAAQRHRVEKIVFSSSCTVYGNPAQLPVNEATPVAPVSPYGRTKVAVEDLFSDLCATDPNMSVLSLRYFNPIGAHPSGLLGEVPQGTPNNLLPYVMQVAAGQRSTLSVFGGDYDTADGTCIRDYVHVVDIAKAHVRALDYVDHVRGFDAMNLGTGRGSSVLEIITACRIATRRDIPYQIVDRRAGDAAVIFADPTRANIDLGWRAEANLTQMCFDHWRFERAHLAPEAQAS